MVIVSLGFGCLLGAVGILGEYLGRVHDEAKGRPTYLLKECTLPDLRSVLLHQEAA
jgi:hypothetical protein